MHKSSFRLRLLWGLSGLMGVGGLLALVVPLAYSMFPSRHDLYVDIMKNQMVLPLDIEAMEPNRIYRFDNTAPNLATNMCLGRIYAIKRTDEQVSYLRHHPNIKPIDKKWQPYDQQNTRNVLRSVRPDVFVFASLKYGNSVRVSRRFLYDWFRDHVFMTSRKVHVRNNEEFLGAISVIDPSIVAIEDHANTYDLAGRSVAAFMDPLMIPPHFYDDQGRLVIGWKADESAKAVAGIKALCRQWYK